MFGACIVTCCHWCCTFTSLSPPSQFVETSCATYRQWLLSSVIRQLAELLSFDATSTCKCLWKMFAIRSDCSTVVCVMQMFNKFYRRKNIVCIHMINPCRVLQHMAYRLGCSVVMRLRSLYTCTSMTLSGVRASITKFTISEFTSFWVTVLADRIVGSIWGYFSFFSMSSFRFLPVATSFSYSCMWPLHPINVFFLKFFFSSEHFITFGGHSKHCSRYVWPTTERIAKNVARYRHGCSRSLYNNAG